MNFPAIDGTIAIMDRTLGALGVVVALGAVAGCESPAAPAAPETPDAAEPPDPPDAGPPPAEWALLIGVDRTLAPGQEVHACATRTTDHDLYLGGFRMPPEVAVHHSSLTFDFPDAPDQTEYPCNGNNDTRMVFVTGAGTNPLELPENVGVYVPAGQQFHLTLHLFNTGESELTVHAGIEGLVMTAAQIEHPAQVFAAGAPAFTDAMSPYSTECVLLGDQTIVALMPHMHERGIHFKTELVHGGETLVLYDEDFEWESQEYVPLMQPASAGDTVRTSCSWDPMGRPINSGASTLDEMCVSFLIRYPVLPGGTYCSST